MRLVSLSFEANNSSSMPYAVSYLFDFSSINGGSLRARNCLEVLESMVESEYGPNNFLKTPVEKMFKGAIQIGVEYRKQMGVIGNFFNFNNLTMSITYTLSSDLKQSKSIHLMNQGKDEDLMSRIYDQIRNAPGLDFSEEVSLKLKRLDLVFSQGYVNKYSKKDSANFLYNTRSII